MRASRRSSKSKRRVKSAVRVLLILLLIALLGVVTVFLIRRSGRPAIVRPEARPISGQKVDVKDDIHFTKVTGGKNILDVRAPRLYGDSEGLYHLAGRVDDPSSRVLLEIRGRDGRLKFEIDAAEVVYDVDWTHLVFRGGVNVRTEDIEIKGSAFNYRQARNIITSNAPVSFKGSRFRGECRRARYDMDKQNVRFLDGITLIVNPFANDPKPLVITGAMLTFERHSRIGEISGNVRMTHGRSFGRADNLQFAQFTDKDGFRLFEFKGGVRIDVDERPVDRPAEAVSPASPPEKPPVADEGLIFLQGGRQRLEAGEVTLLPYGDQDWLHLIAVRKGGRLEILNDGGKQTTIEAEDMKFYYNEDGSLRDFMLSGRARIQGEADGRSRLVEAPKIDFNSKAGNVVAAGEGENRPRTISAGREITADNMVINLRNNDFKITGGVKIVSLPQKEEVREAALFDSGQTMFMTAATSTYEAAKRQFGLEGKARLWQGRDSLEAEGVTIVEDTGDMTAAGAVRSVFFQRPKGKDADERIEITADQLARDPKTKKIVYTGSCTLTVSAIVMTAGRLTLEPDKEGGKYRRIIGDQKRVVIIQGPNKAEGDMADYDLVEDVIVLTGRPVLDEKDKGVIQCGKLTFHPADGKISIEKQSAERSATIIKS